MGNPTTLRVRNTAVAAAAPPEWDVYSPTVRFGPSPFNVASVGKWRRDGSWIDVEVEFRMSGAVAAGRLAFDLPVPVAEIGINCGQQIGGVYMIKQGSGRRNACVVVEAPETSIASIEVQGGGFGTFSVFADNVTPFTWANTDGGVCTIRYRA